LIKNDEIDEFVFYLKEAEKKITLYDLELFIKIQFSNVVALMEGEASKNLENNPSDH
jgi:hypothetical protein